MSVLKKLQTVRKEIRALGLEKKGWNPHTKSHFFELSDFLPQAMDLFDREGIFPRVCFEQIHAELTFVDVENPKDTITFTSPMSEAKLPGAHAVQNLGAVHTYLRRYLYILALELLETDETEHHPEHQEEGNKRAKKQDDRGDYPQSQFNKNLKSWVNSIVDGDHSVKDIIDTVETKYRMSEDQKKQLRKAVADSIGEDPN